MIASLRGVVIDKGLDTVVIECAGVGYECSATPNTIATLPRGEEVFVLTAHVVREDSQTLYAFADGDQRRAFGILQSVSGVGARLALGVLATLSPGELSLAVHGGDVKALQKAPGVGKRLAERMAVDLKGKLPEVVPASTGTDLDGFADTSSDVSVGDDALKDSVVEAMTSLGFGEPESVRTVDSVLAQWPEDQERNVSVVLRAALSAMNGGR